MNSWNEKTTVEKIATVISGIALCVWLVLEFFGSKFAIKNTETISNIAIAVVCVCEAISFWKTKRVFSYIAIAGLVLIVAVMILQSMIVA